VSEGGLRLDKWLWHARFVRTRRLASELVAARRVRVNGQVVVKTHQVVRPGDVVTLTAPAQIRVVRVTGLGLRCGQSSDAVLLYETLEAEGGRGTAPRTAAG
jgi:ribosome-associated heat shock protein Hsp15